MRPWKVALLVGALAVVGLLAAVAIASGADQSLSGTGERGVGQCDGDGLSSKGQGSGEQGGMMRGLGASEEMAAWLDEYGDDPNSVEAQNALQRIRDEHRAEMQEAGVGHGFGNATGECDSGDRENSSGSGVCDREGGQGQGRGEGQGNGQGGGMMGDGNGW